MPRFELSEIVAATGAKVLRQEAASFSDVVTDTRKIKGGELFVALSGERFDGADFAADAVAKGATGVLAAAGCPEEKLPKRGTILAADDTLAAYQGIAHAWRMKFHIPVVAITGSNGKTTTKDLTAAALSALGPVEKTQANFNNEIGLPLTLLGIEEEHAAAVVEMGMRGLGQIRALAGVAAPTVGIVTNVGETHMELLGSIERIAQAKGELAEAIPAGGSLILNADNPYVAAMRHKARASVRVLTFGIEQAADVQGMDIRAEGAGMSFTVQHDGRRSEFSIPMLGQHNVYNALAAIAAGLALGLSTERIRRGLSTLKPTKMRFEHLEKNGWHLINDAYNASPMSMKAAIETLSSLATGRKIAVLGDMLELGDIAREAHLSVGRAIAEHGFDALVTRGELGEHIAEGAQQAGMMPDRVYRAASHEEAADILKGILAPGDTVLFKGSRGMAMEKIIELI